MILLKLTIIPLMMLAGIRGRGNSLLFPAVCLAGCLSSINIILFLFSPFIFLPLHLYAEFHILLLLGPLRRLKKILAGLIFICSLADYFFLNLKWFKSEEEYNA